MSSQLKVSGAVGHMFSSNVKSHHVSDVETGISGTHVWRLCFIDGSSNYTFFFDVVNTQ